MTSRAMRGLGSYGAVPDREMTALLYALIRNEPLGEGARRLVGVAAAEGVERGLTRLLPLLHGHRDFASLSSDVRRRVEDERRQARLRHVMMARTAGELAAALNAEGITPLFLKGFALAATVYASPSDRPMADLDVAVRPGAFDAAVAILMRQDFVEKIDRAMALGPGRHAATFKHRAGGRIVDLHQHVLSFSRWSGADDGFWQRAVAFPLDHASALTLAPEDHLLHVGLHGYAHHPLHTPFRWMVDACRIVERAGDAFRWDVLRREADRQRCEGVMAAALEFLKINFAAAIPSDVLADLRAGLAAVPARAEDDAYFRLHGHLASPSLVLRWRAFRASYRRHESKSGAAPFGLLRWAAQRWQTTSLGATLIESLRRLPRADSDRRKQRQGVDVASKTQQLREAPVSKREP